MKRLIVLWIALSVAGCATLGKSDPNNVTDKVKEGCWILPAECKTLAIIGGAVLGLILVAKSSDSKEEQTQEPVTPDVAPIISSKPTLVIDTDMSIIQESDPDDVQAWIAQASDLRDKYDVTVIASGYGETSPLDTIRLVMQRTGVTGSVVRGATRAGHIADTEGARRYIELAKQHSPSNKLQIEIWGAITTFAQAVRLDPTILPNVEVFWVGNSNRLIDQSSFDFLKQYKNDFILWRDEEEFRGIMERGVLSPELEELHQYILDSNIGDFYAQYPIFREPRFNWKAGDLSLYLYREKGWFREVFTSDGGQWRVANGVNRLISENARNVWIPQIKRNVDGY